MNIAVLSGGTDGEREVSLKSGAFVAETLDAMGVNFSSYVLPDEIDSFLAERSKHDLVFPMFHGAYGEDGTIFGLLESLEMKHTHSPTGVHSLCYNKYQTNTIVRSLGIPVARSWVIERGGQIAETLVEDVFRGRSFFVKPNTGGSSLGAFKVSEGAQINDYIKKSQESADGDTLVEEYLSGDEYSVGVIGDKGLEVLPIMQVVLDDGVFFDYDVKYNGKGGEEVFPKDIDSSLAGQLQDISKRLYRFFGCETLARFDFIVVDGTPHVLEINTVPGFSAVSIIPRAWRELGRENKDLIQAMIDLAA